MEIIGEHLIMIDDEKKQESSIKRVVVIKVADKMRYLMQFSVNEYAPITTTVFFKGIERLKRYLTD